MGKGCGLQVVNMGKRKLSARLLIRLNDLSLKTGAGELKVIQNFPQLIHTQGLRLPGNRVVKLVLKRRQLMLEQGIFRQFPFHFFDPVHNRCVIFG